MNYTNPAFYKAPDASDKHMCNIFSSFDLFRKTQFFSNGKIKKKSFCCIFLDLVYNNSTVKPALESW